MSLAAVWTVASPERPGTVGNGDYAGASAYSAVSCSAISAIKASGESVLIVAQRTPQGLAHQTMPPADLRTIQMSHCGYLGRSRAS